MLPVRGARPREVFVTGDGDRRAHPFGDEFFDLKHALPAGVAHPHDVASFEFLRGFCGCVVHAHVPAFAFVGCERAGFEDAHRPQPDVDAGAGDLFAHTSHSRNLPHAARADSILKILSARGSTWGRGRYVFAVFQGISTLSGTSAFCSVFASVSARTLAVSSSVLM